MVHLLKEFDANKEAVINPGDCFSFDSMFPKVAVGIFSPSLMEKIKTYPAVEVIGEMNSSNGRSPIYRFVYEGKEMAIFKVWVGAPATVACMEEMIAKGVQGIVLFGACGVLQKELVEGSLIIPIRAIRDEGTSYHYAPSSDEISLDITSVSLMQNVFEELKLSYTLGKTWTTDAMYRETKDKVYRRKAAGAICVEMECSAAIACAAFRNIRFAQFLYASDNLDASIWEPRLLGNHPLSNKERLLEIACHCASKLMV